LVTDGIAWSNLITPGYCWYGNDEATYKNMYGALYNWYAVNVSSLCPSGWHVPNDAEWTILTNYLSKGDKVGGKLKDSGTTNWKIPNIGATNYSGFTALPGGYRFDDGTYTYLGSRVYLWSSTEYSISDAWNRYMLYSDANVYRLFSHKTNGLSVRCIKD
jgi:uncharacterized protein (TIGR02145 family)